MAAVYSEMSHRYIFLNKDGVVEQHVMFLLPPCVVLSDHLWRMSCQHRVNSPSVLSRSSVGQLAVCTAAVRADRT